MINHINFCSRAKLGNKFLYEMITVKSLIMGESLFFYPKNYLGLNSQELSTIT